MWQARPRQEQSPPETVLEETMIKLVGLFPESLIDDDAALVRKTPPAEKMAGETPSRKQDLIRL